MPPSWPKSYASSVRKTSPSSTLTSTATSVDPAALPLSHVPVQASNIEPCFGQTISSSRTAAPNPRSSRWSVSCWQKFSHPATSSPARTRMASSRSPVRSKTVNSHDPFSGTSSTVVSRVASSMGEGRPLADEIIEGFALLELVDELVVARGRLPPVDDLEEGVDEVAAGRAVVVVVGVLPDVEREDGVAAPERALVVLVDDDVAELIGEAVVH